MRAIPNHSFVFGSFVDDLQLRMWLAAAPSPHNPYPFVIVGTKPEHNVLNEV